MEVRKASEMTKVDASSRGCMAGGSAKAAMRYDATGVSARLGAWEKEWDNGVGNSSTKQTACRLRQDRVLADSIPAWRDALGGTSSIRVRHRRGRSRNPCGAFMHVAASRSPRLQYDVALTRCSSRRQTAARLSNGVSAAKEWRSGRPVK